jgi:hypothetical protein
MEAQLRSLYEFLMSAGVLSKEFVDVLNTDEVRPMVFTTNWRGQTVVDIGSLATVISKQNTGASESFVKGVFNVVHHALYPNHTDLIEHRQFLDQLYANRNTFLQNRDSEGWRIVQSSSSLPTNSLSDVAFGDFDEKVVNESFANFMKLIDSSMKSIVQQRIAELPVTLMSKKFLGELSNGTPMDDAECMTQVAKQMLIDNMIEDADNGRINFVSYFSTRESYLETVLYDDADVNLEVIRSRLTDSSTVLSQAFESYVQASINMFDSKE